MKKWTGLPLALALGAMPGAAGAVELTLFHTWSNESEMAALNTIVDAFEANTGNTITAASVPHETAGESPLVSLFVAGTPPNLFIAADAELLPRPEGQGPGAWTSGRCSTRSAPPGLPRDGAARRSPSTARC